MNPELIVKAMECNPCTALGKNLKSVITAKQFRPHKPCVEPKPEIQIDFGGPIFDKKGKEVYFLVAMVRFSKYLTLCIYEKTNGPNVLKCLNFGTRKLKITELLLLFDWIKQNVWLEIK